VTEGRPRTLLIRGGTVLRLDDDPHHPHIGDILVEDGKIVEVGTGQASSLDRLSPNEATIIDATGRMVVPGFVNSHYHSHDVFLKGSFEPSILEFWALNALPRAYPPRSDEEIRLRTLLGAVECIRNGITTTQDMLTLFPLTARQVEVVRSAYRAVGLRCVLALQVADVSPLDTVPFWRDVIPAELQASLGGPPPPANVPEPLSVMEELFSERSGDLMSRWAVAPSSPERCSRVLLERLADLAKRHDLPVFSHIYISRAEALNARQRFTEHGGSLIELMKAVGLLGKRLTLAHGVWLDEGEVEAIAAAGTNVAINPLSNLKTKNGIAPIRQLLEARINIALGCDNCSCSDAQNIFQAMKLFTYLAAVSDPREGPPYAIDAVRAATTGGAKAIGLEGQIGAIQPGMRADLVLIDTNDPIYVPFNSAVRQLVYGEGGRGVETVIIDGRIVMKNRRILTLDESALQAEIKSVIAAFRKDYQAVAERTERLYPYIQEADRRIWEQPLGLSRYVGR
jgi:5-methylthioadenosine/S-adenosylhomocysteine deaminase